MKTSRQLIVVLAFLLSISFDSYAQEPQDSTLYSIEIRDGNEYLGKILSRDQVEITLLTDTLSELTITVKDIKRIQKVVKSSMKDGQYWFENPHPTRYFWAPSGYGLKKDEAYYQNMWVLYSQISIGITDHFTIGGGIMPFLFFLGPTPVWITPKISIPVKKDKYNVGLGVFAGAILPEETSICLLYGSNTFGSKNNNLTISLGYGFVNGELVKRPVINVSGMVRIGPRGYLLTENYYQGAQDFGMFSFGGRKIIKKMSLDFGFLIPYGMNMFFALPWLGIALPMGE